MSRFVLTAQLQLQAPTNVAQVVRQIQSQLNNVNVNVQVQNVGQAQRQLNNVTTACNNATTAADRLGRTFGTSIRRFAAFGIATRAVSLFTNTLSSAIKEAIAFDQELVKVIQVSGATRAELDGLVLTVTRLSTSLGVSSRDVLEAGKTLVQAGVSFDDARIALDALAKSALAPNFDSLSETTEGAVAILAQFKQGVGALEGQLSSVNAVAGAFAVEASDLIDVVRRAGGVFKSSGGNLNELLALFTSVRATTRESAESIGTGLRTIFTRIQRPKTIEFLKQFGVQLTDLNGRFIGPFEAVKRLSDALAGLGEGDITFIRIAEELGGFRQIGKVLPLLQEFQTAQQALNVAQNAGTGLTNDALTAQQALAIRITKVKEEFLALARSVTETATFQVFANTALNLASALIKLADSLKPIIPLLTVVAGVRLARGFGNFAGGILGGLGSTRTFNKGGKVHQFARGGMVPGSGNRDTVPAMLTPGEFVIRKSSVNKLGASNLAAMNENKYATGGILGGLGSTRTFNKGGKVHQFARGGMVPGSGNRDTVPAMLTPGEFVMKKSAVQSMGATNLKAMNRGGKASRKVDYEAGVGPSPFESAKSNKLGSDVYSLQKSSGLTPGEFEMAKRFADTNGYSLQEFKQYLAKRAQEKKNKSGLKTNTNDLLATLKGGEPPALSPENERLKVMLGGDPRRFAKGGTAKNQKQTNKETDLPTGGPTEFTHIQSSSVNVPRNLQKYADQNGIGNIARLYTNMGLDLPKTWNRNWATNKKDFFGAFRDTLGTYIENKDVFKTLRTGNKIYRFSGRGRSDAQNLLADNYEQIQDALAYNVLFAGDKFFDTDLDVDKIMPRLLSKSVREVLNDDAKKASALIKGFQETSAFKVQGVQGRQKTTTEMRNLLQKSAGGLIQKFAFGGKARKFGIAALEGSETQKTTTLPIDSITNRLLKTNQKNKTGLSNTVRGILGLKGQNGVPLTGQSDVLSLSDPQVKESIYNSIKNNIYGLVSESARNIGSALNIPLTNRKQTINPNKLLNKIGTDSTIGSVFEGALSLLGGPFVSAESGAALDFPRGIGRLSQIFTKVGNMPVDAKKTSNDKNVSELLNIKAPNFFADFIQRDTRYKQFVSSESSNRLNKLRGTEFDLDTYKRVTGQSGATLKDLEGVATLSRQSGNRKLFTLKSLGGIIQKFAKGGFVPIKISQDSASKPIIGQIAPTGRPSIEQTKNVRTTLGDVGLAPKRGENAKTEARLTANVKNITLGEESGPFSYDEIVKPGLQFIDEDIKQSLSNIGIKKQSAKITNDKAAQNVISGFAFETFAENIIGKSAEGGSSDFDFINPSSRLSDFTKTDPLPKLLDAKNTLLPAASIAKKAFGYKKRNPQSIAFERMQTGGNVQKFADGGLVSSKNIGAAILENVGFDTSNTVKVTRTDIESKLPKTLKLTDNYPIKSQKSFTLEKEGLSGNTYNEFSRILRDNLVKVAENSASSLANDLGLAGARTSIPAGDVNNFLRGINDGSIGNLFEDTLKVLSGSPFSTEPQRAFDFNTGISNILRDDYKNITSQYVDAKSSLAQSTPSKFQIKAANALAQEAITNKFVRQETSEELNTRQSAERKAALSKFKITKKFFGGVIQKFARGGIAEAPLVDDILQAPGSILPKPSSAIQSLIKAGGGAIDIDRTLKRTVGDKAYAKAPTAGAKQAVLDTFFNDESRRLQDIKSAPLTQFGKELQIAIKSRQINPNRLSIISKSRRVRGVDQYLSRLFGIPVSNMIFTQGGSKEPALSALRTKGPRSNRVPFATGGGVGSDSVPALLTPGEFVVNRKSAQSIGYGNLNRMNKVGKYANGGVVQHFAKGTSGTGVQPKRRGTYQAPTNVPSMSPPTQQMQQFGQAVTTATANVQQNAQATNTSTQANNNARQSTSNAGLALSILPAAIQSILPPIDESSSALAKLANNALGMVTTIGSLVFALDAFNIKLKASTVGQVLGKGFGLSKDFNAGDALVKRTGLRGRAFRQQAEALEAGGLDRRTARVTAARNIRTRGISGAFGVGKGTQIAAKSLQVFGNIVSRLSGPLTALTIVSTIVGSFRDLDGQLQDAIKAQDTAKAQTLAVSKANADAIPLIGSLVGSIADSFTGGADALAGFLTIFGGNTADSIKSTIAAQIATAKANESLKKASEESAKAMEELQKGTITASEGLQRVSALTADAEAARQANLKAITDKSGDRAAEGTFTSRNVFTLGGLLGETNTQRNRRIGQEQEKLADENIRLQKESFAAEKPLTTATARSVFARGGNVDQAKAAIEAARGTTPEELRRQNAELEEQKRSASAAGDKGTVAAIEKQQQFLIQEADQLDKELGNLSKEVKRSKDAFAAMNLELQGVSAAANAGVVGLNNYLAAQEFGNNAASNAIAVLEASITSAAQGIADSDFGEALNTARETLLELGATPEQVAKVQNNIRAVNTAQKQFPSALSSLKKTFDEEALKGLRRGQDPTRQKELIGRILEKQLQDAAFDPAAIKSFKAQFDNLNLDPQAIEKLLAGDVSVLEGPLKEIGEAALNQLIPVLKAQAEAQDTLNKVLKSKIELENKLVSAQRQRLDIELEAAEIAAKYGGPAVTPEIRRQNVIAQANVQSRRDLRAAGNLQQGTAAEFNQRNTRIRDRLQEIADIRTQAAGTGMGAQAARDRLEGSSGVRLEAEQQRLQELAKSDYETTKQLIKLKEDELQLIKEKNKLEQDSIQSLISGDIEKFFEQQAAVGATAAIATGNQSLMNAFGASALGAAAQDIQRQQQAGVQTLFGQQLGGADGLTERAFGAALGARGVQDPRLAAIAAGTTAEEVSLQKDIVDLAGTLTNYGDVLVQSADNELNAANLQLQAAQKQLDAATQRVKDQQAQATKAKPLPIAEAAPRILGGLIYASTGKFINFKPRGTDTVPAMLTPGEFVVRREAVQRGNNLSILKAMNRGQSAAPATSNGGVASMASGGVVRYRENGSTGAEQAGGGFGSFIEKLSSFGNALISFNDKFSANIDKLNSTTFNVKLDASNININLTGTSFVGKLKEDLQQELFAEIGRRLGNYQASDGGKLMENKGIVPRA